MHRLETARFAESDDTIRISLAGAIALALAASIVTAVYIRRQARARARRVALLRLAGMLAGRVAPR